MMQEKENHILKLPVTIMRGGTSKGVYILEEDLPKEFTEVLGTTYRERINTMVLDIVKHSENLNDIVMSKEVRDAMIGLRRFMFERVYEEPNTKKEEDKIKNIIGPLYEYYLIHVEQIARI